ncbi:MAG: alpha-ketoglutarate-dependent dioxygenase AlkB [Leptolyngbya sp. SIOISBB]|nr:alpha-ketoglutarate-dependent dioxygenase AlkB [Leptolyngbya sp. SIOISBB]
MQNLSKYAGFRRLDLDDRHHLWQGQLPSHLLPNAAQFEDLWQLHPDEYNTIQIHGRVVKTPRWEQAFNQSYCYSGYTNLAKSVPEAIMPIWEWIKVKVDARLNGILMTWYDGSLGHYIGKHRDSTQNLIPGSPIVTLSLGESRVFRMRPWQGNGYQDFPVHSGMVFVMPYATNSAWTHEVPMAKKYVGQRIAITFRAFMGSALEGATT